MVVPVDMPNDDLPQNEPPIVLPLLLLEDKHDSGNAKSENPPPPPPKVEDVPPPIPVVVPSAVVAVCIDQREHFTTKHKFATRNYLLEWVREKSRKLGFSKVSWCV